MNQMTMALVQSGVATPTLSKRLWLWIKDHPGVLSSDLKAVFKTESPTSIMSTLQTLKLRKMVEVKEDHVRIPGTQRVVMAHRFHAIGKEYELLPLPFKTPKKQAAALVTPPTAASPVPAPAVKPNIVDSMTVKEARAVYLELHKLFGGIAE